MKSDSIDSAEFLILENIYSLSPKTTALKQRDLSKITRTSLGMTNSILKRLTQKGWITIKKLNSRNIKYAVTLDGFNEILKRSYNYFKRTISNITYYKDTIDKYIQNASKNSINTVLLAGISDLDFIVEHCCHRHGLTFIKSADLDICRSRQAWNILIIYSENIPLNADAADLNSLYLSELILKGQFTEL